MTTIETPRLHRFGRGARALDFPVDILGRHRLRSSIAPGSVTITRSADPSAAILYDGTAILFMRRTWIGSDDYGFWEQVAPGAVTKTITEADVRFLQNHDPNLLFARTNPEMRAAGKSTLDLLPTPAGLRTPASMAPTSYARDAAILLDRGDLSQMSFAFDPIDWDTEQLEDGSMLVTITELRLYDVSVVTYPAYEETDAGLRAAAFDAVCREAGFDATSIIRRYAGGTPLDIKPVQPESARTKRARLAGPLTRSLNGWTLSDLWPLLDDAVVEMTSTEEFNSYWYVWLVDISDEWFVYEDCRPGATSDSLFQVSYTIDAAGKITLGTPVEVVAKTTYLPVNEPGTEDEPPIGPEPTSDEMSGTAGVSRRHLELQHRLARI